MLITFSCEVYENIVMFGDVGKKLLDMMGYSGKLTGYIPVEDISTVQSRLRQALDQHKGEKPEYSHDNNTDAKSSVSLEHRAFPLFEMFDAAQKEKCAVKWESS